MSDIGGVFAPAKPKSEEAALRPDSRPARQLKPRTEPAPPKPKPRAKHQPRPVMVPLGILPALAGMSEDDASMLMSILGNLSDVPLRSRKRIIAALGKVFE